MAIEARGLRNKNPLNLRISPNHWLGKLTPSIDPDFETFDSMVHGVRAAALNLMHYDAEGFNTITKIINKWAPSSENPTASYIQLVSDRTGFDADAELDLQKFDDLFALVKAMADEECGESISQIADSDFEQGVMMALQTL